MAPGGFLKAVVKARRAKAKTENIVAQVKALPITRPRSELCPG
jgi:hypothetical protein